MRLLHLTFHDGTGREIEAVAAALAKRTAEPIEVTTWRIFDLPSFGFDPAIEGGNQLYDLTAESARRVWSAHRNSFEEFDAVITSDTTPLCRIFLENGWSKPLIVWVSNRCNFHARSWRQLGFPDDGYYETLRRASSQANVQFVASTEFERVHGLAHDVDFGTTVIGAAGCYIPDKLPSRPARPSGAPATFLHPRSAFLQKFGSGTDLPRFLQGHGVDVWCERYGELDELRAFDAVLYLPYQWYVIAFFETLRLGLPALVPTPGFLEHLALRTGYWFEDSRFLLDGVPLTISEWYRDEFKAGVILFESWPDLRDKVMTTDFGGLSAGARNAGLRHRDEMLTRWEGVFRRAGWSATRG